LLYLIIFLTWSVVAWAHPFDLGRVDYFNEASLKQEFGKKEEKIMDWREPIIGQDGHVTYYEPPPAVLALLETPNDQTAQAYLDWQKAKTAKIEQAQKALEHLSEKKL